VDGEMTGYGRYIFTDSSEYRGIFGNGLPLSGMLHPVPNEVRRLANYVTRFPGKPLWHLDVQERLQEDMADVPLPPFIFARTDCLALVNVTPPLGSNSHNFNHLKRVTARLTWARPIHGDQPLWNAEECRGKIVAIMRGPRPPSPPCSYGIKLYHAQNAGAVGVIFVDWDPDGQFTMVPRVESAQIYPGGPILEASIPCFLALNKRTGALQQGALHTMMPIKSEMQLPAGWIIGLITCLEQESGPSMSKAQETDLMKDFFNCRKQEREQEQQLLHHQLGDLRAGVDKLDANEFISGKLFDSLKYESHTPNGQAGATTTEASMAHAILSKITSKDKAKELAQQATNAAAAMRRSFFSSPTVAQVDVTAHTHQSAAVQRSVTDDDEDDAADEMRQLRLDKFALLDRFVRP